MKCRMRPICPVAPIELCRLCRHSTHPFNMARRLKREEPKVHEWDFVRSREKTIRPNCKLALLVDLMQRPCGANIADLMSATGWKNHSARAAITLIKKRGYLVTRTPDENWRGVYRIRGKWQRLQEDPTRTFAEQQEGSAAVCALKRTSVFLPEK